MLQFRKVSRTRTIGSTETLACYFIFNTFGVEWWWRGASRTSCSKVLNFLKKLHDRIRCTHEETSLNTSSCKPWLYSLHVSLDDSDICPISFRRPPWMYSGRNVETGNCLLHSLQCPKPRDLVS